MFLLLVRYLLQLHNADVDKGKPFYDSDDSELDELEYRKNSNNDDDDNDDDDNDDNEGLQLLEDVKRLVGDDHKYSRSQFHSRRNVIQNPLNDNYNNDKMDQFVSPLRSK